MLKALINYCETPLQERGSDPKWGSGAFEASRDGGKRKHNGIDYLCSPGTKILSPVDGVVVKLGYPYNDDLSYRYVRIKDTNNYLVDLFYVLSWVNIGDEIVTGQVVGESQSLYKRYNGIPEHIHLQISNTYGIFVNPKDYCR